MTTQTRPLVAAIVRQFGHPRGAAGTAAGLVMAHRPSNRRRNHWVASLLWLILVITCAVIAIGSAGALVLDFLAGSPEKAGGKETILLIFSTSFNGLIALFVTRPGTR